jgi:Flp pilus assembly protein TadD
MEIVSAKHERAVLKVVIWSGASLILFIALCIGGARTYHEWESRHSLRRANGYFNGGDYRLAAISARRALDLKPEYADAARLMARIAEQTGDKAAIDWRRKVVRYDPTSDAAKLELAACALQFKQITVAEEALESASEASKQDSQFIAMRARIAQARQNKIEAEKLWTKAVESNPNDASWKLELARARLALADEDKRKSAIQILETLRNDPKQRVAAIRALIADGISHRELAGNILELARQAQSFPEADFNDRITYLDILRQMGHDKFVGYLTDVEEAARENPKQLAGLITWMNKSKLSSLAIDFVNGLPPEKAQVWPVPLALADSYSSVGAWPALEQFLRNGNWSQFEFLRRAYLARSYRQQDKTVLAEREWVAAEKEAAENSQRLLLLATTVAEWRWDKETDKLLWDLSKRTDAQAEALHTLYQRYTRLGDASGLYRVLNRLLEIEPDDQAVQNNFAQVALLLKVDLERAHKLAFDLHQQQPANPAFAATYAFALFRQGKVSQALAVMNELTPEQMSDPSVSLYYGIFLVASGDLDKAKPFLQNGEKAPMFPEERQMLGEAKRKVTPE